MTITIEINPNGADNWDVEIDGGKPRMAINVSTKHMLDTIRVGVEESVDRLAKTLEAMA